jgi:hypothetical protein
LAFKGSSFDKTFALGDVAFDNDPLKDRIEAFLDTNFLILFPLPNKFVRVVVEDDNANKDKILTKEVLQKILIDSQCPYIIKEASWLSYFHINFRRVNKYKVGHVFLAGDAAHVHSPAGGLGMNTGIQDAYNLGWKLAFVIKNLAYEKILDTYEQERLPVAENVLNVTEKLTNVMVVRNKFLSFLRQLFLPFFKDCRSLKRVVLNHMAQLLVNYKQSPLSKGKLGGVKVDDKELFIVDKPKNHLFELTKSLKFVLLIHTKGHNDAFNKDLALKTEVLNRYSKQIDVFMVEGQLQEELILIRPDQYIALSCSLKSSNELFAYLNNLFITSE